MRKKSIYRKVLRDYLFDPVQATGTYVKKSHGSILIKDVLVFPVSSNEDPITIDHMWIRTFIEKDIKPGDRIQIAGEVRYYQKSNMSFSYTIEPIYVGQIVD